LAKLEGRQGSIPKGFNLKENRYNEIILKTYDFG
jgi:hypothetical protein